MTENEEKEKEEDTPSENYCDFTVFISDIEGNEGLVVEALSMDNVIAFNILCSNELKKIRAKPFERSLGEYNGPEFTSLDKNIQTYLTEYLDGYGINEHLAAFVEVMSLDKDQRLYMRWLSSFKRFVNN